MHRRCFIASVASVLCAPHLAHAKTSYPDRPITLVMGFPPAGFTDTLARRFAQKLGENLGQSIVVINKPGGGTSIATAEVARANPDGYTLLFGVSSLAIYPTLQPGAQPRDPINSLVPVAEVNGTPFVLLVRDDVPARNLQEFVAYAKNNPTKINMGSAGIGTVNHLLIEMFNNRTGTTLKHIPYKGGAAAMLDLRAGRVEAIFATPLDALPFVKGGYGRILATTAAKRMSLLPDVPALAETIPDFDTTYWTGIFAPKGTPRDVIETLSQAVAKTNSNPGIQENTIKLGAIVNTGGPEQLHAQLVRDTELYKSIIERANIKAE